MRLLNSLLGGSEWRAKPPEEKAADIGRHRAARAALTSPRNRRVIPDECPAYYQLNQAVIDAEQHVPWWRR